MSGSVEIRAERCKGCGLCVSVCSRRVLEMSFGRETNENGYYYPVIVNKDRCVGCGNCYEVCGDSCISVERL